MEVKWELKIGSEVKLMAMVEKFSDSYFNSDIKIIKELAQLDSGTSIKTCLI